ncbi:head decoration protein [Alkalilacustris brevis]|uniref:head decoration protein n=1 Tax=Alkalilacustris brevis TaxID=2026338 RepID=UPI000E0D83EE|nr:head decoration protein [Alkalilacustris brevis]
MTVLRKPATMGDILKYEVNPNYNRESVTLLEGTSYHAGAVLGRITASDKYRLSPAAEVVGNEGAETAVAVLLYAVDASATDSIGVVVARGPAIVSKMALVFDATVDDAPKTATKHGQLAALGIVPRDTA